MERGSFKQMKALAAGGGMVGWFVPSTPTMSSKEGTGRQGVAKDPESDRRHGDPDAGGLSSGEKSAVARGYVPKTAEGDEDKMQAAQEYAEAKGVELSKGPGTSD